MSLAASSNPALLQITDGTFQFESPVYKIVIGSDGNVRSLTVGSTPILGIGSDGKSGAFFLDEKDAVIGFSHVEPRGTDELICIQDSPEVCYRFYPDRIEMTRTHAGSRFANWAWVPSSHVIRSVDETHDRVIDLFKAPFDGYQAYPRWLTDSGPVVHMPYVTWSRKEKVVPDRNVAILAHAFNDTDEKPFVIRPMVHPKLEDTLVFDIHCNNPDFMLPGGKPIGFPTRLENLSSNVVNGNIRFRVLTFLERKPVASRDCNIQLAGSKTQSLPLSAIIKKSGVYRAEMIVMDGKLARRKIEWVFAYDWKNWKVPLTRPSDFADFWQKTLAELRSQPLDPVLTPQPDQNGFKVYKVNFRSLGDGRVYGWYITPPGKGPFPAVLMLPGNGVYKMDIYRWPSGQYALLLIQVHGYDVDLSNFPKDTPWKHGYRSKEKEHWYWSEWESRDQAFARVVYANCVRAVDFLMSRPEVNKKDVYVEGNSQGGGLTLVTAALDHRVMRAFVGCPGLCKLDWLYHFFLDALFPWGGKDPKPVGMTETKFLKILSYYDAANFTPDIRCPIHASIAMQDTVTIGGTGLAALRNIQRPPTLANSVWTSHRSDERANQAYMDYSRKFYMKVPVENDSRAKQK